MDQEYKKNKTMILYRGEKYKVKDVKSEVINGKTVVYLQIPHSKYSIWINANYTLKC